MNAEVWGTVLGSFGSLAAVVVAIVAFMHTRSQDDRAKADAHLQELIRGALDPLLTKITDQQQSIGYLTNRVAALEQGAQQHDARIGEILDRLARLETKIDVFWKSVAMDAAKIIHSPDPKRQHIDELLDAFMNGTITAPQAEELREILTKLRDWEPGTPIDFPVHQGEQVAAAMLLATMKHVMEKA